MKSFNKTSNNWFGWLLVSLLSLGRADAQIFVSYCGTGPEGNAGCVSEYSTTGTVISPSPLISGLYPGYGGNLALSGTQLFFVGNNGQIWTYTTSGTLVNPQPIQLGFGTLGGIAVSGGNFFVSTTTTTTTGTPTTGAIAEYSTAGALLNASLVSGLTGLVPLAASGNNLYIASNVGHANYDDIIKYTVTQNSVGVPTVIAHGIPALGFLNATSAITVSGNYIYAAYGPGRIGRFATSGDTNDPNYNPVLINGGQGSSPLVYVPIALAVSGNRLYIANAGGSNNVSVYILNNNNTASGGQAIVTGNPFSQGMVLGASSK